MKKALLGTFMVQELEDGAATYFSRSPKKAKKDHCKNIGKEDIEINDCGTD